MREWPPLSAVRQAAEIYLRGAYSGVVPPAVLMRLEALHALADDDWVSSRLFEREPEDDPAQVKLRLGNRHYPHMKLVVQQRQDCEGVLFRVDTHEMHIRPAIDDPDYPAFCALVDHNREVAGRIESAWEEAGLPTFKAFLREDLRRRTQDAAAHARR